MHDARRELTGWTGAPRAWLRAAGLAAALALLLLLPGAEVRAAELRLVELAPATGSPASGYPVPSDPGMVFYMQRSENPNTVVYAARFDAAGALDRKDPISAFWRRFNAQGEKKKLSMLERRLAYGVQTEPRPGGGFDVRFRAVPQIPFVLEERAPGQAVLTFAPDGQPVDVTHGYVTLDSGGMMPEVTELRVYGTRRSDGRPVQVVYGVSGGTLPG